jgi:hypothetical protein
MVWQIRRVNQTCGTDEACTVTCNEGETAINAVCPNKSPAALTGESGISCGTGNQGKMIGYCAR